MKRCKPAKGKRPEPFWRESKQAWYIQLRDGRQRSLGRDEEGAWKEYHKLMLHEDGAAPMREYQVREIFEIYLEYCQKETASYDLYSYFLNDAAKSFGRLAVIDLKPFHVTRWVDRHPDWGTTTRSMVVTVVKAAFNYCVKQGHLEGNPIRLMLVPAPEARDRVLSPEECQEIFTSIKDRPFADYLLALSESGARPGEVAKLTPENVDLDLGVWVLPRHKTRKKTGKARVVYLSSVLLALTKRRVADTQPGQPLFRNSRGNAWTRNSLYYRFETLRKKFPCLEDVVPYTFRATYATEALERGIPDATVSELLGHHDTRMIHKHYNKLSQKVAHLREAAEKARRSTP